MSTKIDITVSVELPDDLQSNSSIKIALAKVASKSVDEEIKKLLIEHYSKSSWQVNG